MDVGGARAQKRIRSRAGILSAARELVLEVGPDALSLRAVAARAGYSPASLYEYFESKDALVAALAAEVGTRLGQRMRAVPATLAPARRLVRLGEAYIAFARDCPEDFRLLFGALRSQRGAADQPVPAASPFALVAQTVAEGLGDGSFGARPDFGAHEIAYGLWAFAHGLATLQTGHLKGFAADFELADRRALEAFVAGLGANAGAAKSPR